MGLVVWISKSTKTTGKGLGMNNLATRALYKHR